MTVKSGETELILKSGDLRFKAAPFGASLRGLWRELPNGTQQEIITTYSGSKGKVGGQGDVLIPFPGRVGGGKYVFEGQTHLMDCNDKDGPNAIHGFLRLIEWEITDQSEQSISFMTWMDPDDHKGYPFSICAAITYILDGNGMRCNFSIENIGENHAPVAEGFHPYFTVGSELINSNVLQIPMESILEFENLIPTGKILAIDGTEYDFRQPRPILDTQLNTCFVQPIPDTDGLVRVHLQSVEDDRKVSIWMDSSFNSVVIYSGDPLPESHRRKSLAIEPMTCASDSFNHPEWGLVNLAPGDSFTGSWGVSV